MLMIFAVATFTLMTTVAPVAGQDAQGAAIVDAQFEGVTTELGLTPGARVSGRLARNRTRMMNIEAPGGDIYFIGACDEACRDVDLIVRDASGREVGRDHEPDDVPIVVVQGAVAGRYTVEVSMADCTGQCHWGVGVFR